MSKNFTFGAVLKGRLSRDGSWGDSWCDDLNAVRISLIYSSSERTHLFLAASSFLQPSNPFHKVNLSEHNKPISADERHSNFSMRHKGLAEYSEMSVGMVSFLIAVGNILMNDRLVVAVPHQCWLSRMTIERYVQDAEDLYSIGMNRTRHCCAIYRKPGHISTKIA